MTRVAIAGVGLIGGSIALSAREAGLHVTGWDPREGAAATVCDEAAGDLASAVAEAEVVVVATPIDHLADTITMALEHAPDAVVTDVGSVKVSIAEAVHDPRYIGGHPLAGAEVAGVEHARAGLFENATWYLTPTSETEGVRLER